MLASAPPPHIPLRPAPQIRYSPTHHWTEATPISSPHPHPEPPGTLALRTVAMPADTNPSGDIFGGWLMSLMDLAAGTTAAAEAKGRVATRAVSNLEFHQPVKVGDVVCCYAEVRRIGRTSITVGVEAWVLRYGREERLKVTGGEFVLVAVDANGRPRVVK